MNDQAIKLLEGLIRVEESAAKWFSNLNLKDTSNPHRKTITVLKHILKIMKLYKETQE